MKTSVNVYQKLIIKLCLGFLLIAIISLEFGNITQAQNAYMTSKSYQTVQVIAGDSVWTIAAKYVTNKDDIRELIMAIRQINGLSISADIYPGQIIKVPLK